jgi:hypothetical protein
MGTLAYVNRLQAVKDFIDHAFMTNEKPMVIIAIQKQSGTLRHHLQEPASHKPTSLPFEKGSHDIFSLLCIAAVQAKEER